MRQGLAIAAALLALALPATASAATRYASTFGGTVPGCPQVTPCSLEYAITAAGPGDEIVVLSGTYDVATTIETEAPLFIHGEDGLPRPRIVGAPGVTPFQSFAPQHLSYLAVEATEGDALFLPAGGTVLERLELLAHGESSLSLRPGTNFTLTDSLLVSGEAIDAGGIFIQGTSSGAPVLRNDTIVASGAESFAVGLTVVNNDVSIKVQAVNVIASAETDAIATVAPEKTGSSGTIAFDHSNLDNTVGDVTSSNGQTAPPRFVAGTPSFAEAPGSPTIDAGVNDPANGGVDLGGNPRSLPGSVSCAGPNVPITDIGAYEFLPAIPACRPAPTPPETTIMRATLRKRKAAFRFLASGGPGPASFECKLDRKRFAPCASPKVYKHLKRGRHLFKVRATAGGLVDPTPAEHRFKVKRKHHRHRHSPHR